MIEITKTTNGYEFNRIDDDGENWSLGSATERTQDEGTEDEYRWFEGYFDTQAISFQNDEECERIIANRKPNEKNEIIWA